jgi:hypothetical protein
MVGKRACCCCCRAATISQEQYEQLQQMAAHLLGRAGPLHNLNQQQQQQQYTQTEQLELLHHLLTMEEPYRKLFNPLILPGPVPFHVVRQVRCCILLAECLAGCLKVPGLCRKWLQQEKADSAQDATHVAQSCLEYRRRLQQGERVGMQGLQACVCRVRASVQTQHAVKFRSVLRHITHNTHNNRIDV